VSQENYDVFISYRRANGAAEARLIRSALADHGLRVFLDVTDLSQGHYDDALLRYVALAHSFVVVLSPNSLDGCFEEGDWLRVEIGHAIATQRNIIPVMLPGFQFPARLPEDIATLPRYQGVQYSHVFFEAVIGKLLQMGVPVRQKHGLASWSRRLRRQSGLAMAVAAAVTIGYLVYSRLPQERLQRTVTDLRNQFRETIDALPQSGTGDFARVDQDIGLILELDPKNGHGLYYSGEVKRIQNRALFTSKSCVIRQGLADSRGSLDSYENDFRRYLDIEKTLPASETGGDYSAEACYARSSGYCPQRTAWINHLLANDLYEEAALSADATIKADQLAHALAFAQAAAQLYRDGKNPGFEQCTPTEVLIAKVKARLSSFSR
jgi:TIR domain